MPRKIKRVGKNQTLLLVEEEEPESYNKSNAVLPKEWEAPTSKRSYRLGSLADKIRKGLWVACPGCGTENIEFVSDVSQAWLRNENECRCPICGEGVSLA